MSQPFKKAIFGVASVILISRLLGFVREMVIADKFGTSVDYDLYLLAAMFPALAYGVINFSVVYLFVPYLSKKKKENQANLVWSDIMPSFNLVLSTAVVMVILISLLAPEALKLWGRNLTPLEYDKIILYSRLISLMVLLGTTEAFMRAYLNVNKVFTYPAAGYIVYNIICISAILIFYDSFSTGAIVIGLLAGFFFQNLYLFLKIIPSSPFKNYKLKIFNEDTGAILSAGSFIILIEIINRSYFLFDRYVAVSFGEGVISALNYSQVLVQLPDSIIGFAIGAVIFPFLSDASSDKNTERFAQVYRKTITGAVMVAVPIAVFFWAGSVDLITVLFKRGVFDQQSVQVTSAVLEMFTPSIVALFVVSTSIRAVYSGGWIKPLLVFAVIVLAVKIVGNFLLPIWLGYPGITAATSLAHIIFASMMVVLILKKINFPDKRKFAFNLLKIILVGILTAVSAYYFYPVTECLFYGSDRLNSIMRLVTIGAVIVASYVILLYIFQMKQTVLSYLGKGSRNE